MSQPRKHKKYFFPTRRENIISRGEREMEGLPPTIVPGAVAVAVFEVGSYVTVYQWDGPKSGDVFRIDGKKCRVLSCTTESTFSGSIDVVTEEEEEGEV